MPTSKGITIGFERLFDLLRVRFPFLGDERPAVRLGGGGEQIREGGFGGSFVDRFVLGIALERREVLADRGGVGFDLRGHEAQYSRRENEGHERPGNRLFQPTPRFFRRSP